MNRDEYTHKLFSLGCAYSFNSEIEPADLENTVLDGLQYYWKSNDLFFMLYGLLVHRIADLVHVERLINLAKKRKLPQNELALLVCLSLKLMHLHTLSDVFYKMDFSFYNCL